MLKVSQPRILYQEEKNYILINKGEIKAFARWEREIEKRPLTNKLSQKKLLKGMLYKKEK